MQQDITRTLLSENYGDVRPMPPRLIVLHTTESQERTGGALAIAKYFQPESRDASATLITDKDETIRCVSDSRPAYAALGVNEIALHIEQVGVASQSKADWADPFSAAEMHRSAHATAVWCLLYHIPVVKLTSSEVRANHRGICGHVDVTNAFHKTTHQDPGPNFPWEKFITMVKWYIANQPATPTNPEEDEVISDADKKEIADLTAKAVLAARFADPLADPPDSRQVSVATTYRSLRRQVSGLARVNSAQIAAEIVAALPQGNLDAAALEPVVENALRKVLLDAATPDQ